MITKKDFPKVIYDCREEEFDNGDRNTYASIAYSIKDCVSGINKPEMVGVYELKEVIIVTKKETIEQYKA